MVGLVEVGRDSQMGAGEAANFLVIGHAPIVGGRGARPPGTHVIGVGSSLLRRREWSTGCQENTVLGGGNGKGG